MLRFLIPALIVFNLILFGRSMGWLPGLVGDIPDPSRISRQVNPEQLKIVPSQPPAGPAANSRG
jgi:hypothetical protein